MPWNASISAGSAMGSLTLCASQRRFFSAYGHALQEVRLALVEAAKSVCAQRLHDADVDVRVVVLHERGAIDGHEFCQTVEVVVEQFLAHCGGRSALPS